MGTSEMRLTSSRGADVGDNLEKAITGYIISFLHLHPNTLFSYVLLGYKIK